MPLLTPRWRVVRVDHRSGQHVTVARHRSGVVAALHAALYDTCAVLARLGATPDHHYDVGPVAR